MTTGIYEAGIAVTAENYIEDIRRVSKGGEAYLIVRQALFRVHSLLAHARLMGRETPGVQQVVVRMDWRGLSGRMLTWDHVRFAAPGRAADNRFVKTITLTWADLRDAYFACLRKVSLPFLDVFPTAGWSPPTEWLTPDRVGEEFTQFGFRSVRLFDD